MTTGTIISSFKKPPPFNRRLVSSLGRAPVRRAGGGRFKPRPDQHAGSLNNWEESAAFVITSANDFLVFSDKDEKP